jgi:hypothetical protein
MIVGHTSGSSPDTDGELAILKRCGDLDVEFGCEWEANYKSSKRRRLRSRTAEVELPNSQRVLGVELEDVTCTIEFGDESYETDLTFPDDFNIELREADDAEDFYIFVAKVEFNGTDYEGEFVVEIVKVEDLYGNDVAVYDDSEVDFDCLE